MYLKRKIDNYLDSWRKDASHKPLIIKGARQTGKTAAVRHFAGLNYDSFIEINFVEQPAYKSITQNGYGTDEILRNITLLNPAARPIPGKTLIFFDELQDFPEIATALKFFKSDGRYDVICSGSLLGINYHRIESNSVGYKTDYTLHSLDFEEFLWAKGYSEDTAGGLLENIIAKSPFTTLQHNVLMSLFRDFCILGGMPEIVATYISNGNFQGILDMQRQLLLDYKEDVRKYTSGLEQTRIMNVFNRIPVQLAQENKKFQISKVAPGAKAKDYWGCVEWLNDAGIINICHCMNFPELPLKGNYDPTRYKLYLADTGMLIAQLDDEVQEDLRANHNLGTYKGALYENIVAESLVKMGADLFYYKRQDSTLEQDFFLRTPTHLVPIEVKAGNEQSKSLRTLIESDKYNDIAWGIKLAMANIGYANNILTLPYYCTFLLKRFLASQT